MKTEGGAVDAATGQLGAAPVPARERWVLTLSCPDRLGIVAGVAGALAEAHCNIAESAQFGDADSRRFFMRVALEAAPGDLLGFTQRLRGLAHSFDMDYALVNALHRPRALVMVSREGHCLHHLLSRRMLGELPFDVTLVTSNHPDQRAVVEAQGVPFIHIPISPDRKAETEARIRSLIDHHGVELIALARYMQILSPDFCADFAGRIVNIHHSFLPSFKGAHPYRQAFDHGVKLVGASAHFVTADLDEGPIIEQQTTRVDHCMSAHDMARRGRDIECAVLTRALTWVAQGRVLLNGRRTVVL